MDYNKLAELIFPNVTLTPDDLEAKYPERNLPEGARVTRVAPSPTGFIHLGGLYQAVLDEHVAHQSGGVFYLRIEDTDRKRLVDGAVENIIDSFAFFGINFDEGAGKNGADIGNYGPYRQSERREIYHVFAKKLMSEGRAYPCFCTAEELEKQHELQASLKADPGYYGEYAKCRNLSLEQIEANIKAGMSYIIRFKSEGDKKITVKFKDEIKGELTLPQNDNDFVLLKTDGLPTYHFAHAVDDHLMRTTHVVRGEEWLSTLPYHLELFRALGFKCPKYAHTAQIMKGENGGKRKLSKRKDPEAAVTYYVENGYPAIAVKKYLFTLLSSSFEEWLKANKNESISKFPLKLSKMSISGCLFDNDKLNDISKTVLSEMTADEVFELLKTWAPEYDKPLNELIVKNGDFIKAILSIGRGGAKPRKDLTTLKDVFDYVKYFFDEYFEPSQSELLKTDDAKAILNGYALIWSEADEQDVWFEKIKTLSEALGYCPNTKEYKQNPEGYKGHVGDVSAIIRLAVTGRESSPDMCTVLKLLGKEKILRRIEIATK